MRFVRTAYAARSSPSAKLSFATICDWASNGAHSNEIQVFTRPSILFRPQIQQPNELGNLVEPPGTAPGSEPFITQGFIVIVPEGTDLI